MLIVFNFFKALRTKKAVIIIVVVAMLAAILLLIFLSSNNPPPNPPPNASVVSSSGGGRMSFYKPGSFTDITGNTDQQPFAIYVFNQTDKDKVAQGYLGAAAVKITPTDLKNFPSFNGWLTYDSENGYYQQAAAPINSYAVGVLRGYQDIELTNATKSTDSKMKSNAWVFDLFAQDSDFNQLSGKAVFAWTDKAIYYYLLATAPRIWEDDSATWQKMINSISID